MAQECSRYFNLCNVANECKVELAFLYMVDKAEKWITNHLSIRRDMMVEWDGFIVDLMARFKDDDGDYVVEQFNKLHQVDSLEGYIGQFEDLRSALLQNDHVLSA